MSYFVIQWIPGPALLVIAACTLFFGAVWYLLVKK
jgi:hypothetical protein